MIDKRVQLVTVLLSAGSLILWFGTQIGLDIPSERLQTTWALAIGILLLIVGLIVYQNKKAYEVLEISLQKPADWLGVTNWQVLLLVISFVFVFLAAAGAGFWIRMYSPVFVVVCWFLGMTMVFVGGYRPREETPKLSRLIVLVLILVTVFSFLFRGLGTASIPMFLTGDEASAGISAADFASGDWNNIFVTKWFSFPSLFSYIQSLFIKLFGQTTEALRLLSAVVGSLTVAAVFLVGKAMFGMRGGIFAALCLSALHFHIHFSRLGLNNIWDGFWFTLTIGALWYGWHHNRRFGYLLAGLGLGFSQYFYVSSRGLFGIIVLAMLVAFIFQRARFYRSIPHFVLMFILSLVILFPLIWFYVHEPAQFLAPLARVSFLRESFNGPIRPVDGTLWKHVIKQMITSAQTYTYTSLEFWYTPETPILRPIFAFLFYMGLFFLFVKNRDSRFLALLLWLILFNLIGGLSENPQAAQRYVAVAPACALLVGYGLHKITEFFENLWHKHTKVITGLSYLILGTAMISDLYFYFIEYQGMHQIDNLASHGTVAQQLANHLERQPDGTQVAFFAKPDLGYYSIPSPQYLAPQVEGIDILVPWTSFDKTALSSDHIIFVFLPQRESELVTIMAEYPSGSLLEEKAWNQETLFWMYDYWSK